MSVNFPPGHVSLPFLFERTALSIQTWPASLHSTPAPRCYYQRALWNFSRILLKQSALLSTETFFNRLWVTVFYILHFLPKLFVLYYSGIA